MREKFKNDGMSSLFYAGVYGEEYRKIDIESARKEFENELDLRGVPIRCQSTLRPYVHVVGADEVRVTIPRYGRGERVTEPNGSSEEKRADNVGRALRTVYDLIKCNPWEFFCTQTVNENLLNRSDLDGLIRKMSRGVADQNKRVIHKDKKIRYVWVPELHSDGTAWHLHGVMSGFVEKDLRRNSNGFLEWSWSADKVGFFSLSRIRSKERTASYVRKYITKNVAAGGHLLNKSLYYPSKNLERPVTLSNENILHSAEIFHEARKNCGFSRFGKWGEVYTLQGENAKKFMEKFGDVLEVVV